MFPNLPFGIESVTLIASNPHHGTAVGEMMARGVLNGKLYVGGTGDNDGTNSYNAEYIVDTTTLAISQKDVRVKVAWRSVPDYTHNKIYFAGEAQPAGDTILDWARMQSMVGYIDLTDDSYHYYQIPQTGDCNELIGVALDLAGHRLLVGERNAGGAVGGSIYPNGRGLWTVGLDAQGVPLHDASNNTTAATRVHEAVATGSISSVFIFEGRIYYDTGSLLLQSCPDDGSWIFTAEPADKDACFISPTRGLMGSVSINNEFKITCKKNGIWTVIDCPHAPTGYSLWERSDGKIVYFANVDFGTTPWGCNATILNLTDSAHDRFYPSSFFPGRPDYPSEDGMTFYYAIAGLPDFGRIYRVVTS